MNKVDFDIIIIGSGIGGLVCGCYLAKAGKKVLIVEKNAQPGGYCTSFKRGNFIIDAAVHCVQNVGKDNILHKVIQELGIDNRIIFKGQTPQIQLSLKIIKSILIIPSKKQLKTSC